jgi:hypothetical protein
MVGCRADSVFGVAREFAGLKRGGGAYLRRLGSGTEVFTVWNRLSRGIINEPKN